MRFPGDALLNPSGALPQTTPNAQSESTFDASMQKGKERLDFDSHSINFRILEDEFQERDKFGKIDGSFANFWIYFVK